MPKVKNKKDMKARLQKYHSSIESAVDLEEKISITKQRYRYYSREDDGCTPEEKHFAKQLARYLKKNLDSLVDFQKESTSLLVQIPIEQCKRCSVNLTPITDQAHIQPAPPSPIPTSEEQRKKLNQEIEKYILLKKAAEEKEEAEISLALKSLQEEYICEISSSNNIIQAKFAEKIEAIKKNIKDKDKDKITSINTTIQQLEEELKELE